MLFTQSFSIIRKRLVARISLGQMGSASRRILDLSAEMRPVLMGNSGTSNRPCIWSGHSLYYASSLASPLGTPNSNNATRVVVADCSQMDCQLLVDAIERQRSLKVEDCAVTSTETLSAIRRNQPDIVVLSTRLQDGPLAGFSVLQNLHSSQSTSRVVVLLDDEDPSLVVEAFRAGARGVFCRRIHGFPDLRKCMQSVRNGKVWASNKHLEWIVAALTEAPEAKTSGPKMAKILSKREQEIARMVAAALTNRELSEKLVLSQHTVKNYLSRIFEKLGISTRSELVLYVLNQSKPTVAQMNEPRGRLLNDQSA
jgi:two-component system, NarL family, nitrate/nitrite response regulator NarL